MTSVPASTAARYAAEVDALDTAIVAYRRAEPTATGGRKSNNNGVSAECSCGRKIRVSRSILDAGPIICSLCDELFEASDGGE